MWYEFLRPKKKVVIATIITLIVFYVVIYLLMHISYATKSCAPILDTCNQHWPKIMPSCDYCITAIEFFNQLLSFIIIPAIIMYIFYAILFYKIDKK